MNNEFHSLDGFSGPMPRRDVEKLHHDMMIKCFFPRSHSTTQD